MQTEIYFKYIYVLNVNELEKVDDECTKELLLEYKNEYEE
jgi:hypothetical protein